jgi:pyridoxal phosphate enzyme (YggS family)
MPEQISSIARNLERVRAQIAQAAKRAGRSANEIVLIAVSKTFPVEAIRAAYDAGMREFAENRVQLPDIDVVWHLIGHLQSNKAKRAAQLFDRVDSVDSLPLAQKLNAAAGEQGKRLPVLIEVHMGGEATKSGIAEAELPTLARDIAELPHLELRGLMTVPPYSEDLERVRPYFRQLRALDQELGRKLGRPLPVISMGMSHDFEVAIEEGSTQIRIGTALFGERNANGVPRARAHPEG